MASYHPLISTVKLGADERYHEFEVENLFEPQAGGRIQPTTSKVRLILC